MKITFQLAEMLLDELKHELREMNRNKDKQISVRFLLEWIRFYSGEIKSISEDNEILIRRKAKYGNQTITDTSCSHNCFSCYIKDVCGS